MPSANNRHRACHGWLRTLGRHPEAIVDISCIAPESPEPGRGQKRIGAQALEMPWARGGGGSPRGSKGFMHESFCWMLITAELAVAEKESLEVPENGSGANREGKFQEQG